MLSQEQAGTGITKKGGEEDEEVLKEEEEVKKCANGEALESIQNHPYFGWTAFKFSITSTLHNDVKTIEEKF